MRAALLGAAGFAFMLIAIAGLVVAVMGGSHGDRGVGALCLIGFGAASVVSLFASADTHSEKSHRPRKGR